MRSTPDALILFSGGLDSLLSARLLMLRGLDVLCLHFYTPFFGNPAKTDWWRRAYGLDVVALDASLPFMQRFASYPPHGTGKTLNPCIDCKIVLLGLARGMLEETGAKFIATGEVVGQRPMSQRTEALNVIARESGTGGLLLRPLCALHMRPTPMEESGLVDRSRLLALSGRGRNGQLELAKSMGISDIPAPAGGCRLTERENARRYWQILRPHWLTGASADPQKLIDDLNLVNLGRVLFHRSGAILVIGRNERDNQSLAACALPGDIILRLPFPGPLALLRHAPGREEAREAADILCSYAPRARLESGNISVSLQRDGKRIQVSATPLRHAAEWRLPEWAEAEAEIHELRRRPRNQAE